MVSSAVNSAVSSVPTGSTQSRGTAAVADTAEWESDSVTPPDGAAWDLLVVGGGTAGIVAARTAAEFGASVLLVERARMGGDCLWTGCVPSKALLAAAHAAADARAAVRYGVHAAGVRVDFAEVMAHVRTAISTIEPVDSAGVLRAAGVGVVHGTARFTGQGSALVQPAVPTPDEAGIGPGTARAPRNEAVRFRRALLAIGSEPAIPNIPGLADVAPLTSDNVWALTELPGRLLVLGGGSIGCELGQAFARLGSTVTIVEAAADLLPREDPRAAALLAAALADDGVDVRYGQPVVEFEGTDRGWYARLAGGTMIGSDRVLVAVGRRPRTAGIGLADAGVALDDRGYVAVDARLRTTNPRVWAAGDVTGHPQFTHVAGMHGSLAASNAVLGLRRRVDLTTIPRVTFTQPEVAAVGVSPHRLAAGSGLTVRTIDHADLDRAIAEDDRRGVTRVVLDRKGRVVGASIVGPRAGETLAELVLAVRHGLRARDLAGTIHAYPTYGDGVWKAGVEQVSSQLHTPTVRTVTGLLVALRRRRLGR